MCQKLKKQGKIASSIQQIRLSCYQGNSMRYFKDSNQFHAICLDTYPPIFYLNEFSKQVIEVIDHLINKDSKLKVAYTFDAGPHAFLFVHEDNVN